MKSSLRTMSRRKGRESATASNWLGGVLADVNLSSRVAARSSVVKIWPFASFAYDSSVARASAFRMSEV